jgi:hypothetical protein
MELVNDGLVNVQVNVVDISFDGGVNIVVTELPLPGKPDGGMPPVSYGLRVGS